MHSLATPQNLTLRLGDRTISVLGGPSFAALESAVALLRTVFEDHFADPEYRQCLFFHGCTLIGARRERLDFTVRHQADRVVLSDWSWRDSGAAISSLPRQQYATAVFAYARQIRRAGCPDRPGPAWLRQYVRSLWMILGSLCLLTARYLRGGDELYPMIREAYAERFGARRRPLELEVELVTGEFEPWHPVRVLARPLFGPLRQGALVPLKLNGEHLIRGRVEEFCPAGVALNLEGVGWSGVKPGDRLVGLELFHP
jgi:hypothetical protein